jgi:hypothetical protein
MSKLHAMKKSGLTPDNPSTMHRLNKLDFKYEHNFHAFDLGVSYAKIYDVSPLFCKWFSDQP